MDGFHGIHRITQDVSPFGRHRFVPPEIVVIVFNNLDWRSLVRCSAVCRFWQQLIRDTLVLRYKVELGAYGMEDGLECGLSIPERMHLLKQRQNAWRTLNFKRRVTVPVPGECHAYELAGGVFAKAMNPLGPDNTPAFLGSRHLTLINLPSASEECRTDVRDDIGVTCRDFAMDPTQDLLAMLEQSYLINPCINIHLKSLSTGESHPRSSIPVLRQPLKTQFEMAEIQICEDILAIFFRIRNVPRLLIWHWPSGKSLVKELELQVFRWVDDFSMVSSRAFMMTCRHPQGGIRVYTFPDAIMDESFSSARLTDLQLRCTLLLFPTLQPHNHYAEMLSRTAPFTAYIPKGKPFATSDDARIHIMSVTTQPTQPPHSNSDSELGNPPVGHVASFIVAVRNRILLKYSEQCRTLSTREGSTVEVPWEEWGPRNTRWIQGRNSQAWVRYVHGSRFVRTLHNPWPSTRCRMQVLDFGVHPPRAEDNSCEEDINGEFMQREYPCGIRTISGPSLIRDRLVFKGGGVESRLPYRELTMKNETGSYSGFMIDEEQIVGLSAQAFANGDMKQVDVFTF